ncbi:hypothetical protein ACQRIU_000003 [Beauveria bassiana]
MRVSRFLCKTVFWSLAIAASANKRQSDPVDPSTATDCTYLLKARDSSWTCARFEDEGGIGHADFVSWNPSVKDDCSGIKIGNAYCVEVNYGLPRTTAVTSTDTTTTTSDSQTSTTTSAPTASLPSPTQDGLAKDCSQFYLAKSGDTCNGIVAVYGSFSLDEFLAWNPAVGRTCNLLLSGTYYCVDAPSRITTSSTTTTVAATSTTLDNGIATPQPTQPGMVKDCVKFHYVFPGNTCAQITSYNGISQQDFAKWNPQVGEGCTALWANTYACVGVAAFSLK